MTEKMQNEVDIIQGEYIPAYHCAQVNIGLPMLKQVIPGNEQFGEMNRLKLYIYESK